MYAGKPNSVGSIKQQVQLHAGKRPLLFYSLLGLRRKYRELAVSRATQLVIEGFPRSSPFDHTEDNVREVFARIESLNRAKGGGLVEEQVACPSATREELKSRAKGELEARGPGRLIAKAEAIYSDLAGRQPGECR